MSYQKTWEFTDETYLVQPELRRIRALVDLPQHHVKAGDLGGFVEKPENLQGNAWVAGNARVCGNARVYGSARVFGDVQVFGNAQVFGNTRVFGEARVFDKAQVYDYAYVYGEAQVYGDVRVYGNTCVYGEVHVCGNARVYGNARVSGSARVSDYALVDKTRAYMIFQNVGSENGILTVYKTETGLGCTRGCFSGTTEEFLEASAKKHVGDLAIYGEIYQSLIMAAKKQMK